LVGPVEVQIEPALAKAVGIKMVLKARVDRLKKIKRFIILTPDVWVQTAHQQTDQN
jgi:hypothetical protein